MKFFMAPNWHFIPYNAFLEICTYLSFESILTISRVSRRWASALKYFKVWEGRIIDIQEMCVNSHYTQVVYKILKQYVTFFEDIHIRCSKDKASSPDKKKIWPTLIRHIFPNHLLKSITFSNHTNVLYFSWYGEYNHAYEFSFTKLITTLIARLLVQQKQLERLRIDVPVYRDNYGWSLLQAAIQSSEKTLHILYIMNFDIGTLSESKITFVNYTKYFKNIQEIYIHYQYILWGGLDILTNYSGQNLRILGIKINMRENFDKVVIERKKWEKLQECCPNVKVKIIFIVWNKNVHHIILKEIPLTHLQIIFTAKFEADLQENEINNCYSEILSYLQTNFNSKLELLDIKIHNHTPLPLKPFFDLLATSKNLKQLELSVSNILPLLKIFWTLHSTRKITISKFVMDLRLRSNREKEELFQLIQRHRSMLLNDKYQHRFSLKNSYFKYIGNDCFYIENKDLDVYEQYIHVCNFKVDDFLKPAIPFKSYHTNSINFEKNTFKELKRL